LLQITSNRFPYDGLRISINSLNNNQSSGQLQFSDSTVQTTFVHSVASVNGGTNFSDDGWHNIIVINKSNVYSFFADGVLLGSTPVVDSQPRESVLHMLDTPNQETGFVCTLSSLVISGQLQGKIEDHVALLALYKTSFAMEGKVLVSGNPVATEIRYYDTITGELEGRTYSLGGTGKYRITTTNDRKRDLMFMPPNGNTNITYSILGGRIPVTDTF
jgi:hypothetical protein